MAATVSWIAPRAQLASRACTTNVTGVLSAPYEAAVVVGAPRAPVMTSMSNPSARIRVS